MNPTDTRLFLLLCEAIFQLSERQTSSEKQFLQLLELHRGLADLPDSGERDRLQQRLASAMQEYADSIARAESAMDQLRAALAAIQAGRAQPGEPDDG